MDTKLSLMSALHEALVTELITLYLYGELGRLFMFSNPPRAPSLPSPVHPSCLPRLLLARLRQPFASLARPVPAFSPPRAQAGDVPDHARGSAAAIAAAERRQPPPSAAKSTSPLIPLGPAATRQQIREAIFASGGRPHDHPLHAGGRGSRWGGRDSGCGRAAACVSGDSAP